MAATADDSSTRFARPRDQANVRIPDGTIRHATATAYPDTFFSTPARCSIAGRTVSGFVSLDESDHYRFTPNR